MSFRKFGTGEVLPPEDEEERMTKEAHTQKDWSSEEAQEVLEEQAR